MLGVFYSSLIALQYTNMQAERRARLRKARNRDAVDAQWAKIVEGAQQAFAAAGVKGLTEAGLDRMAKELTQSSANFNTVVDIANSGVAGNGGHRPGFGNYVTIVETIRDLLDPVLTPVPPNCARTGPGTYTKHISVSFSLSVTVTTGARPGRTHSAHAQRRSPLPALVSTRGSTSATESPAVAPTHGVRLMPRHARQSSAFRFALHAARVLSALRESEVWIGIDVLIRPRRHSRAEVHRRRRHGLLRLRPVRLEH